ncbi:MULTISPECIES: ATP-grasp domain-containing protein [Thiorhodovibrio]|uniref:ATP-grasp domain-containing protein n=1 Tax=Thiorhodovibrio TaxID=61593 RepID=UPI00191382AF|nr:MULTISPECIES: ATP-grasp domain-containing protein [Thiorhodovibrio]WPL11321.1 carbamoyl phosphate synthase-like protein [Thiorhodovibrio litoralis]
MNVLLLSCGAKVPLVRAWREATAECGGRLTAVDCARDAAALFDADQAFLLPHCNQPDWAPTLLELCERQRIAVLVPTADVELAPVAALTPALADIGTQALVSPASALALCADKMHFAEFCLQHGFPIPPLVESAWESTEGLETASSGRITIQAPTGLGAPEHLGASALAADESSACPPTASRPVFVRPRLGRQPDCTGLVRTRARLAAMRADCPELLVQQAMDAPEYSVDALLDWDGTPLQAVARQRLRIRGGEACTSRVESVPALTELALALSQALGLIGHVMMQAFWTPEEGAHVIEVNARFGGASSLSIAAGLDSPRRLLALLAGDTAARRPRPVHAGLTLLRHGIDRLVDDAQLAAWPRAGDQKSSQSSHDG